MKPSIKEIGWQVVRIGTIAALLFVYTLIIWRSAFDQGADTALCVVQSVRESPDDGPIRLARDYKPCRDAQQYAWHSPFWLLRSHHD